MDNQIFYDELTCRYFRSSREHIEQAIKKVNEVWKAKGITQGMYSFNDVLNDFYKELGISLIDPNYGAFDPPRELYYDDLSIHEVNPETVSRKENKMEKKAIEFEEFNVEVTTKSVCDPIMLLFKVSSDEEITFSLSKGNAKTMIKFLKAAVKLT